MIVLDASAVFELLLGTKSGKLVRERIQDSSITLHAPEVIDLEIIQVMRRYVRNGTIPEARAAHAISDLRQLDIAKYSHEPLIPRIWALRNNLSAYDAVYIALAEAMDAPLLTLDTKLVGASGHRAIIICI